jgi:hypothetical protein
VLFCYFGEVDVVEVDVVVAVDAVDIVGVVVCIDVWDAAHHECLLVLFYLVLALMGCVAEEVDIVEMRL